MLGKLAFKVACWVQIAALLPAMSRDEIRLFETNLSEEDVVLEWGAGGSTLRFSRLVTKYYSIEHSKKWADRIRAKAPSNVLVLHIPDTGSYPDYAAYNTLGDGALADFWDYAHGFELLPETPTVYFLDGRVRVGCLNLISPRLQAPTKVFLHDFQRYSSQVDPDQFRVVEVVDRLALLQTNARS
jgi:hypothetical protein